MGLHGKVKVWQMTEEQRLAYIKKHPIVPIKKSKSQAFSNIHSYGERAKKNKKIDSHANKSLRNTN
ncbi:MAG: hypothetical protein E6780_03590 [Staphylococcus epidermidis]|nr:hypothetical protein [Staphylococcus epidermidis]